MYGFSFFVKKYLQPTKPASHASWSDSELSQASKLGSQLAISLRTYSTAIHTTDLRLCSTSHPGENQVDGLPPALHTCSSGSSSGEYLGQYVSRINTAQRFEVSKFTDLREASLRQIATAPVLLFELNRWNLSISALRVILNIERLLPIYSDINIIY